LIQIQGKKEKFNAFKNISFFFRERQICEKMELLQNDLKKCKGENKLEQVLRESPPQDHPTLLISRRGKIFFRFYYLK
jgi:hypothetical protein